MIKQSLVDVESMLKLLRENQEVKDAPNAKGLVVGLTADVRFEDITFTFEPSRGPLLKGVSLVAKSGQKARALGWNERFLVLLTFVLLARSARPARHRGHQRRGEEHTHAAALPAVQRGQRAHPHLGHGQCAAHPQNILSLFRELRSDALRASHPIPVAMCTQKSVRNAVAVVPQDTVLFNDTLLYNVSLGKLAKGELASEEEVAAACEAAQLTDFVKRQPLGLLTTVGERGLRLSGGEKQRVAIARALLKDSPVFVSDEARLVPTFRAFFFLSFPSLTLFSSLLPSLLCVPRQATSALDSHTEKEVMRAIDGAAKGRTYLTIAHRLSTVADADAIAVRARIFIR